MGDDADSHELLAVVATVHHERVGQALNDGALSLAETLSSITTGSVRDVDGVADLDVVAIFVNPSQQIRVCQPDPVQCIYSQSCVRGYFHFCTSRMSPIEIGTQPDQIKFPFAARLSRRGFGIKHLRQRDIPDLNILVAPLVEQLDGAHLGKSVLRQSLESPRRVFDLDFPVIRHCDAVCTCCRGRDS